jgi:hypothetical protein
MLFASRASGLRIDIRDPLIRSYADSDDKLQKETIRPMLVAEFHARALTETQRIIADRMFRAINPQNPYGSVPYPVGDAMGQEFSTEDVVPGSRYVGYDPRFNIGKYDTRVDIDYAAQGCETDEEKAALKKLVETRLLKVAETYRELVRLDEELPKPWANYPSENGPGVAQQVIKTARDIGIPLEEIVEYEKTQDAPKAGVISMCEAELAKERENRVEDAALNAVIPG